MDPTIVAAGIGAAANLAGGLIGSGGNNHRGRENREAIYNSVAQKVKAARDWGISPLYALGAPVYSPSAPVGNNNQPLGQAIANMGQDVSRAVASGQSDAQRALQDLALQKAALENDYLRSQIASVRVRTAREVGPPFPVRGGQGPSVYPEKRQLPTRTDPINAGVSYPTNPYYGDVEGGLTQRYGESEIVEMLGAAITAGADLYWNSPAAVQRSLGGMNRPHPGYGPRKRMGRFGYY